METTESGSEMNNPKAYSRRRVLSYGLVVAGGGLLATGTTGAGAAAIAAEIPPGAQVRAWQGSKSANGWSITSEGIERHTVEGSNITADLRSGDVATVLLYVLRRFHYEIDNRLTTEDIAGHTTRRQVAAAFESNCLSGTAFAVRPGAYPLGAKGCFFPEDVMIIRDILADCEGVVRWGGDERLPKQSHFQIDVEPGNEKLARVAAKFCAWDAQPSGGAGAIDAFVPGRRRAADALARQQAA
ncbi:hypothetical protein ADL21_00070 [Streptomyces albus subsp. albus]|nr:hypothetical protein ADL21_00070 [Streptomyces albus subsp. albus]